MSKYKIKVKVEIVESDDNETKEATKEADGSFSMVIPESDAISIDNCEKSLLMTNYPAIREAISKHLTDISKKKLKSKKEGQN